MDIETSTSNYTKNAQKVDITYERLPTHYKHKIILGSVDSLDRSIFNMISLMKFSEYIYNEPDKESTKFFKFIAEE